MNVLNYQKFFYNTEAKFRAALDSGLIPDSAIVFVGDPDNPFIYTHGVEFKGGKEKETEPVAPTTYDMSKIYYKKFTDRNAALSNITSISGYSPVGSATSTSTSWSTALNSQYLHIFVPVGYSVLSIRTSNNETLTLDSNFTKQEISGLGNVYRYVPLFPASFTITFNFSIPKN